MTKIYISSIYCSAPGVVCDALRDLEMILAAGGGARACFRASVERKTLATPGKH